MKRFALCLALTSCARAPAGPAEVVVRRDQSARVGVPDLEFKIIEVLSLSPDVYVRRSGSWTNLTSFETGNEIVDAQASTCGSWIFVRHRIAGRAPLVVSLYEVESHRFLQRFAPGFGGSLTWTSTGHLYHEWGAGGTGIRRFAVYDRQGKKLISDWAAQAELGPDRRFVIARDAAEIRILDLQEMEIVARVRPGSDAVIRDIRWNGPDEGSVNLAVEPSSWGVPLRIIRRS